MTTTLDLNYDLHTITELSLNPFEWAMIENPLYVDLVIQYTINLPDPLDVIPEKTADEFKIVFYKLEDNHSEKVRDMLDDVICNNQKQICEELYEADADRFLDK